MFTNFLITLLWVSSGLVVYCYLAIWAFVLFLLISFVSLFALALVQGGSLTQEHAE
jgi:hypothetical protein